MRIALIGTGGISRAHLPGLTRLGEVRVFSVEGAEAVADQWGLEVFASLEEALEWADVVDICTPTHTHFELAKRALECGCHVVCEKPLCRTSADAVELLNMARQKGLKLFPAHVVRYFPAYVTLKNALDAGAVGKVAVQRFSRAGAYPAWSDWFGNEDYSGGLVMDLMIHDLDQARWLAGPVTTVFASQVESSDGGRCVGCHCVLTHESGAISYVRGVWGAQSTVFETSFHVAGDGGYLEYESRDDYLVRTNGLDLSGHVIVPSSNAEDPYAAELIEFFEELEGRGTARVNGHDGVVAVRLAEAAMESIRTGAPVRFVEDET